MLTKPPKRTLVPGTVGQPHIPAYTVCTPSSPPGPPPGGGGSWVVECTGERLLIGYDNGPASPGNPGPFPKPVYVYYTVCRSVWRP